jgi:1-acyl-sn-glycerol-3-phosphate acyltransferase
MLTRDAIVGAITTFLSNQPAATLEAVRRALEREIDAAGPHALAQLNERLAAAGTDWTYYPRDPLARRIHQVLAGQLLDASSALTGAEHVAAVANARVVIVANHLSYSDANLLEVLLHRGGCEALSNRLTVMAGPKVYSSLRRRFSSLCFGTIKTPQNSGVSTDEAVMSARDVARAARRAIDMAHERLRSGDALLVFAEGTRSRTTGMQEMLAGVTRYLDVDGTWVLPVGITGTEALFPVDDDRLHPVAIGARAGAPIEVAALRRQVGDNRRLMMDAIGVAIADLVPFAYRGAYART